MKWYFASNSDSKSYTPLIKAAVESALKNTTLEPHFIYDGEPDELTDWLEKRGVKIIYHRVSFYDLLKKTYPADVLSIPAGAFLRCEIPRLERDDEIVLYTDCDVLFLKEVNFENSPHPEYFSCSSQFNKCDFSDFNTGVMFMNVKKLAESHDEFVKFIASNIGNLVSFDQGAYQRFYGRKNEPLDVKFNHKPYWGIDEKSVILHYHGPKPIHFVTGNDLMNFNPEYYKLYKKNPLAYEYYLELFKTYSPWFSYDNEAIQLLKRGVYPLIKKLKRPFRQRLRNFCSKKFSFLRHIVDNLVKFKFKN